MYGCVTKTKLDNFLKKLRLDSRVAESTRFRGFHGLWSRTCWGHQRLASEYLSSADRCIRWWEPR